jgi:predicted O-linked N-acetylglucosamine transferase (SPINDLY family)
MSVLGLLGSLQDRVGDRAGARASVLRVVTSEHSAPRDVLNAANLLVRLSDHQLAATAAREAYEKLGRPLRDASRLLYIAQRVADLDTMDALVTQLREAYAQGRASEAAETPRTHLLWCDDEALNIEVVKAWSQGNLPIPAGVTAPPVQPLEGRRIRVGYLSSDFREHPTSRLINGLLRNHDRTGFEVFLYCSGWDDGSPMRREVESHVEHVHTVTPLSDEAAAALIRSHRIDVLVELNGPTRANRMGILTYRPAPVQIDYLGWPGTVGGRVVDYVVGDWQTVPKGAEKAYPEKVIRLNKVYQINDYAEIPKPKTPSREKVGLPADRPVIGMFNAINKVGSEVWRTWMRVLHAVPEAVFWVLDPGPAARENLARAAAAQGVDPKRILYAPKMRQQSHWARLGCCDLMLDPWPYGGHTSTADALFAGVPVVALDCNNFAGRVSGALLRAAGLGVFVQSDVDLYVKTAVGLLRNRATLDKARRFIAEKVPASDVFNARSKTRQMEAAYRVALQRVVQGLPPMHISFRPDEKPSAQAPGQTATGARAAAPIR